MPPVVEPVRRGSSHSMSLPNVAPDAINNSSHCDLNEDELDLENATFILSGPFLYYLNSGIHDEQPRALTADIFAPPSRDRDKDLSDSPHGNARISSSNGRDSSVCHSAAPQTTPFIADSKEEYTDSEDTSCNASDAEWDMCNVDIAPFVGPSPESWGWVGEINRNREGSGYLGDDEEEWVFCREDDEDEEEDRYFSVNLSSY
ncbi:hypothetical protein NP233_g13103 [Leucocoprinus birnbaumii]|uniref:Uncharacterized protein n=1 Tax=Leucocoprinus birnbaumii TaxID=56174 RepID=A0AAD5VDC7_9AGAR|nr:hypothetical protein NP233_g13103 [Leucocoprinus birnbaumii]